MTEAESGGTGKPSGQDRNRRKIDTAQNAGLPRHPVPIVGIGASAGGLEALRELLSEVPSDSGACYIVIQHLDPTHESMLAELLGRCTEMPVLEAEDNMSVAPDTVVLNPPDSTLTVSSSLLRLRKPAPPRQNRSPIDTFLVSLAEDLGENSVGVILSGAGSDGTQGLRRIKEAGGLTVAQAPPNAKYDAMPRNAIATGLVDYILAPRDIPERITHYLSQLRNADSIADEARNDAANELSAIVSILKARSGHDFRDYKDGTLLRRIQRRMQVLQLDSYAAYIERLRDDGIEFRHLMRELLVSVTAFFRDTEAFKVLEEVVIAKLADRDADTPIRIWVAGCATGEEAYSIAMLVRDHLDRRDKQTKVQIFATDIDEVALGVARKARYPDSIVATVPDNYLKRYFRPKDNAYEIADEIRELCIFSTQSLIADPPFGRLDLVCCRNLLIYLKPSLQDQVMPALHYALRPEGFLFLGPSENVSMRLELFEAVNQKWRLFRRIEPSGHRAVPLALANLTGINSANIAARMGQKREEKIATAPAIDAAERMVLDSLGPAYAIVTEMRELLYTGGPIERYMTVPRGNASLDVGSLVHEDLLMDVRTLLHRASVEAGVQQRENVSFTYNNERRVLRLSCVAVPPVDTSPRRFIIAFQDCGRADLGRSVQLSEDTVGYHALEAELKETKEYLQSTTEELESSNEELKSANEELMSLNEELQSSNEELETSKEELQSLNEELETANSNLSAKVEELRDSNSDLRNLLESTQIATLFLDRSMCIRRFTPVAKSIFHLIDKDVGRPISDIVSEISNVDLAKEIESVLETLAPVQREVELRDGSGTFIMRILPYRTAENVIDGVVATFIEIGELKQAQAKVEELNRSLRDRIADLEALLDIAPIGIAFADDADCRKIEVNHYGSNLMKLQPTTPLAGREGTPYRFMQNGKEVQTRDLPLHKVWRTGRLVREFRAQYVHDDGTQFEFLMSAAPVIDESGNIRRVIGIFDDVSSLVAAQAAAERRAAQQDLVATLGTQSLRAQPLSALLQSIPEMLTRVLGAEYVKIVRYRPATNDFVLVAYEGFSNAVAGQTVVGGGSHSQAGYTLESTEPVVVEDLERDPRFSGPEFLVSHGVRSGVSVIVGDVANPWGVIGVHSRSKKSFSADDIGFLQSIANVVGATVWRDESEERQSILLAELQHRVKNTLATVHAIANLSLKGGDESGASVELFRNRLTALSEAHDLLFRHNWQSVSLAETVAVQLKAFGENSDRVQIVGEGDVNMSAKFGMDLSMLMHELAVNAGKYGALSTSNGEVRLFWKVYTAASEQRLMFEWQEIGGPPVVPPTRRGVGTMLIETAFRSASNVDMRMDFQPQGLLFHLELPLVEVTPK